MTCAKDLSKKAKNDPKKRDGIPHNRQRNKNPPLYKREENLEVDWRLR